MANTDGGKKQWDDDDRLYSSGSYSDDSPILSYRYDKRRFVPYASPAPPEERERRSTLSVLGKFCLFCAAMILFCVLMYIPVYNNANYHIPKGIVAGWSIRTNRDTKIYVQPSNVTTIYEPKDVCQTPNKANKLLLLIVVCSATENFNNRKAIRETWGSYVNYRKSSKVFNTIREKYKNYDFKQDLYPNSQEVANVSQENITFSEYIHRSRIKRHISSFRELLPALAKALNNMNSSKTEEVPEQRFEDDDDDPVLPVFDMNKDLEEQNDAVDYDLDYPSNIMRIPPKGYEDTDESPDLDKIVKLIGHNINKVKEPTTTDNEIEDDYNSNTDPEFKLVFLLGMPAKKNKAVQKMIDDEVNMYEDIIQEGFIDSYNNLTLKSIMMLKWVTNKCNESVRYILKTDDDIYINVPNLLSNLRSRAEDFDKNVKGSEDKEYLLIGDLIIGARPVLNLNSKWYSPRYMYNGRVYPRYLSGTGYAMSTPTAHALYAAALRTNYFHLEDIYITGMCTVRSQPRVLPRDDPLFSYVAVRTSAEALCCAHSQITAHRVKPGDMRTVHTRLQVYSEADRCKRILLTELRHEQIMRHKEIVKFRQRCERIRLTQVRQERIWRRKQLEKKKKHATPGKTNKQ